MTRVNNLRNRLSGFGIGLIGFTLTIFLMLYLNSIQSLKQRKMDKDFTPIITEKEVKPPEEEKKVEQKQIEHKPRMDTAVPPPGLSGGLSGIEINLPQFSFDSLFVSSDSKDIVGDVKENIVMTEKSVDQPPMPRFRTSPEYPKSARAKNITGYVVLSILVDEDGSVQQVEVLESQPARVFEEASINAVKQWKFEPGRYKGKPVKTWVKQVVKFELQ
ncbi:MAG: energy transducer TonB [Hydrogenothermaceae bacterium]|nr:energy transducer TonB [Hydrogenothermaceae bacterium]